MDRDDSQYYYYLYRRRRLRQMIGLSALLILVLTLGLLKFFGKLPSIALSHHSPSNIPEDALVVNSGLSRSTISRTKAINYEFKPQEPSTGALGNTPDVVTALLEGDLRDEANNQFPASLVQLSASPSGRGRIQISTLVNLNQEPKPAGGTYRGTIEIFVGTQVLRVPLVLYLAPRDGPLAFIAVLLLVIGATIGLAVKWITESLTRIAAASWRAEDLRRSLGSRGNAMPLMAAVRLDEIEDAIRRQDTDDNLEKAFAPLLSNVSHLRSFATAIQNSKSEIRNQLELRYTLDLDDESSDTLDRDFVESIARAESTRIERLRAIEWPWKNPTETIEEAQRLEDQCSTATLALNDAVAGRADSTTLKVLELFRKGSFSDAVTLYNEKPELAPPSDVTPKEKTKKKAHRPRFFSSVAEYSRIYPFPGYGPRGLVPWMARRPRAFAAAASVFVVSLAGLQFQYLNAPDFAGELGDWLGLLLWAAVIELSGVSVLDVLSRLGTTNVRSSSSRRVGPAEP